MKNIVFVLITVLFCTQVETAEIERDSNKEKGNIEQQKNATVIQQTVLGMNVSGNKELPNVLYIVPWKANASFSKPPVATRLVDEIYAPIDPQAYSKKVVFYHQLTTNLKNEKQ